MPEAINPLTPITLDQTVWSFKVCQVNEFEDSLGQDSVFGSVDR